MMAAQSRTIQPSPASLRGVRTPLERENRLVTQVIGCKSLARY
jgi:hypothetical protein